MAFNNPYIASGVQLADLSISTFIRSANFATGVAGFNFDGITGNIEVNAGVFRGTLEAGQIHIPNQTTVESFHVDPAGDTWWGAIDKADAEMQITADGRIIVGTATDNLLTIRSTLGSASLAFSTQHANEETAGAVVATKGGSTKQTLALYPANFNAGVTLGNALVSLEGTDFGLAVGSRALIRAHKIDIDHYDQGVAGIGSAVYFTDRANTSSAHAGISAAGLWVSTGELLCVDGATVMGNSGMKAVGNPTTHLALMVNAVERFRVTSAGYAHLSGTRIYFGLGSNDYISYTDANDGEIQGTWSFVSDGSTAQSRMVCGAILANRAGSLANRHDDEENVIHAGQTTSGTVTFVDMGIMVEDDAATPYAGITFHQDGKNLAPILRASNVTEKLIARNNGDSGYIDIEASAFNISSQARFKREIEPSPAGILDRLRKVAIVMFRRDNNADPVPTFETARATRGDEWADLKKLGAIEAATPAEWDLLDRQMHGPEFLERGALAPAIAELFPECASWGLNDAGDTVIPTGINLASMLFTVAQAVVELADQVNPPATESKALQSPTT